MATTSKSWDDPRGIRIGLYIWEKSSVSPMTSQGVLGTPSTHDRKANISVVALYMHCNQHWCSAQQFSIHATASNNVSNTLLRNIQRSCNIQFAACTEAAAPIYFVLGFAMRIKATALLERNKSPRGGHPRYKNARTMDEVFEPKAAVAGYIPWYVEYIPIVAGWWAFRTVFETAHMSDGNTRVILMITPSPRKYRLSTWVKPSWYSLVR